MQPVIIGIDVGSVALSVVSIDCDRRWIESAYAFHLGDVAGALKKLIAPWDLSRGAFVALTGATSALIRSHGRYDSLIALITGCKQRHEKIGAILHVGGERFGLIQFNDSNQYSSYQTNSTCAAGTGGFLDQQARRLNLAGAEELAAEALQNGSKIPKIATRCAVFAKTDLVHAQQEGFSPAQICDGLCHGVARHIVDTLFSGKSVREPIIFTGGVSRNLAVAGHINRMLGRELICEKVECGAFGAALCLLDETRAEIAAPFKSIDDIVGIELPKKTYAFPPLELELSNFPDFCLENSYRFTPPEADRSNPVEVDIYGEWPKGGHFRAVLGIDVGSTSTKAALVTEQGKVEAGFYTRTAGNPIRAVQSLFAAIEEAADRFGVSLKVGGACVTGAGRKLAGRVIGADLTVDEITAHARAARDLKPDVDTIIEIGGQDSKFTTLKGGRVNFCTMNTVCAAGTGSFIEEQAQKLDCPLTRYSDLALHAPAPMASDRCTVFMERDINHHLTEGYGKEELLATVLHSITENYLSKVATEKHIGKAICFQGATAKNKALVAAFEHRLGKPIHVSKFCHLTGAIGAALSLLDKKADQTGFRGLDLCRKAVPMRVETCSICANHCKITVCEVGGETVASGFLCGRDYESKSLLEVNKSGFSLLRERKRAFGEAKFAQPKDGPIVGLPAALFMVEDLEFWQVFFGALSIKTITSNSNQDPVKSGKALAEVEFCAPMTALHADVAYLLEKADYVFLPFYMEKKTGKKAIRRQYCYYTQYAPALSARACATSGLELERILTPMVHYLYGSLHTRMQLFRMLQSISKTRRIRLSDVRTALETAQGFKEAARKRLKELYRLESLEPGKVHAVLLGRPYMVLSRRMNKGIPDIFGSLGIQAFYQDMLSLDDSGVENLRPLLDEIHWRYAAEILKAAEITARTDGAYPVLITAFRCSPDAFLIEFFKSIMEAHKKPYLVLQLDEHDSSVGYETRIEAAISSFKNHFASSRPAKPSYCESLFPDYASGIGGKTLILPNYDRLCLRLIAANLKREGIDARLLTDTPEGVRKSLRQNSGQCIPVNVVARNFIDYVSSQGLDPARCVLWIPHSVIACNLKMYPHFIQSLWSEYGKGFEKARVYPGSISFAEISIRLPTNIYMSYMLGGLIRKIGCKLRPYEARKGETDAAIEQGISLLESAFLGERPKEEAVRRVAGILGAVKTVAGSKGSPAKRPKVAIFGDLYTRDNEIFNQDLIHFIEENGGEVVTTPYSSYLKMIAWPYVRKWFVEGEYQAALTSSALIAAVSLMEKKYYRYLEPLLNEPEPVYDEPPEKVLAGYGLRLEHTGESMDNLIKIYYTQKYHPDLALFVQASPAFCCPAMVTEAMARDIERITGVPVVSVTYDGVGGSKNDVIVPYLKYPRTHHGENKKAGEVRYASL